MDKTGEEKPLSFPSTQVIIAAYNEEEGIGPTLAELGETLNESSYLVVDGNSSDKTVEIAKDQGAKVIIQKGFGKGSAISQGIECISDNPDYIVFIDADYTYPCKHIHDMIHILEEKPRVGMVLGNRFNHHLTAAAMKNPYAVGNRFLAFAQRLLNGIELSDPLTGLRVVRWEILKKWKPKSKGFDVEAEMNHRVERKGYEIVEISIPYRARLGEKKLKLTDGFAILKRIIQESIATHAH